MFLVGEWSPVSGANGFLKRVPFKTPQWTGRQAVASPGPTGIPDRFVRFGAETEVDAETPHDWALRQALEFQAEKSVRGACHFFQQAFDTGDDPQKAKTLEHFRTFYQGLTVTEKVLCAGALKTQLDLEAQPVVADAPSLPIPSGPVVTKISLYRAQAKAQASLGHEEQAKQFWAKTVQALNATPDQAKDFYREKLEGFFELAGLYDRLGKPDLAEKNWQRCLKVLHHLPKEDPNQATIPYSVGTYYFSRLTEPGQPPSADDLNRAEKYFKVALKRLKQIPESSGFDTAMLKSQIYEDLGLAQLTREESYLYPHAVHFLKLGLKALGTVRRPTEEHLRQDIDLRERLGQVLYEMGKDTVAERYVRQGLDETHQLLAEHQDDEQLMAHEAHLQEMLELHPH